MAFQGPVKVGPFDVTGETARAWLALPTNPNGQRNKEVVVPLANGRDLVQRSTDSWIVDFGARALEEVTSFIAPYGYVATHVLPVRAENRDTQRRERWWLLGRSGADLRAAIVPLTRYIATPRISKHRLFVWLHPIVLPDSAVVAVTRDDDTTFGILHSRFHEAWSLRLGTALEDRPRYTPSTTFETFPFPENLTPNLPATTYADTPHAQAIAAAAVELVAKRDVWLNPPDLVDRVPEVVAGFPDRIIAKNPVAAATLKTRTLTNLYNTRGTPAGAWLDALHARLDAAVAAAYGWPADISTDDALAALLALNLHRAKQASVVG